MIAFCGALDWLCSVSVLGPDPDTEERPHILCDKVLVRTVLCIYLYMYQLFLGYFADFHQNGKMGPGPGGGKEMCPQHLSVA